MVEYSDFPDCYILRILEGVRTICHFCFGNAWRAVSGSDCGHVWCFSKEIFSLHSFTLKMKQRNNAYNPQTGRNCVRRKKGEET